jgi:hypothetical protein
LPALSRQCIVWVSHFTGDRCRSSVVEHSLGKELPSNKINKLEVENSELPAQNRDATASQWEARGRVCLEG